MLNNTCCGKAMVKIEGIFRCLDPNCPVEAKRTRKTPGGFGPRQVTDEDRRLCSRESAPPSPSGPTATELRYGYGAAASAAPYEGGQV